MSIHDDPFEKLLRYDQPNVVPFREGAEMPFPPLESYADYMPDRSTREAKAKPAFRLVRSDKLSFREPEFLVDGLIESESLSLFFGDPGSGKSFAAVDVACCVATGRAFHGLTVKAGAVVYILGEGQNGIKRRTTAWEKHHATSLSGKPLYVSETPGQFLSAESVAAMEEAIDAAAQDAGGAIALIIIDTLNRNMGAGDENSAKDMTAFISSVDMLKARYGATALVVHHTGHGNKERARGSMSLHGALDAEYRIERVADGPVTLTNTKMKEAGTPPPMAFKLIEIEVGRDRLGRAVTSAALEATTAPAKSFRLKPAWKLALDTMKEAKARAGHQEDIAAPIHVEAWRTVFYEKATQDTDSAKRGTFHRARKELVEAEILDCLNDEYRLLKLFPPFI